MFELRIIVIIFLLIMCFYFIYSMYDFNSHIINKATMKINENIDDNFDLINEKLEEIEETMENIIDNFNIKIESCHKKINDVFSLQNKVNEITKMNGQSIHRQLNQYDESENYEGNLKFTNLQHSLENSMSPNYNNDKFNECFIKHKNSKNKDNEMFYMSSKQEFQSKDQTNLSKTSLLDNNFNPSTKINPTSQTSSNINEKSSKTNESNESDRSNETTKKTESDNNTKSTKSVKSAKSTKSVKSNNVGSGIFTNTYKKRGIEIVKDNLSLDNETNLEEFINSLPNNVVHNFLNKTQDHSSVILEMNSDVVNPYDVSSISPKFLNAMKILNDSNIIKNNSFNKLDELVKDSNNSKSSLSINNKSSKSKSGSSHSNSTYSKSAHSSGSNNNESSTDSDTSETTNSSDSNELNRSGNFLGNVYIFENTRKNNKSNSKIVEVD